MWTVTSQTRKAVPGLAIILLAAILVASILFAYQVQRVKNREYGLTLDQPVSFTTPIGNLAVKIPSRWTPVQQSAGVVGGWKFPLPAEESLGFFYLDLLPIQPNTDRDLSRIINQYLPSSPKLKLTRRQGPDSPLGFPSLDLSLLYQTPREINVMVMRIYFLPDNSSLALIATGPQASEDILQVWMDLVSRTLTQTGAAPSEDRTDHPPAMDGPHIRTSIIGAPKITIHPVLSVA